MKDYFSGDPRLFEAFLKSVQYLVRLQRQADIWEHVGKFVLAHFRANWLAVARRDSAQGLSLDYCTLPAPPAPPGLLTAEIRGVIADVLDSGFLASSVLHLPAPSMTAFLPIVEKRQISRVMLIGHQDARPLPGELLSIYLALADLVGTTVERLDSEREVDRHRAILEQQVKERTADIQTANEKLRDSRRAAINLMDDAVAARHRAERAGAELRKTASRLDLLAAVAGELLGAEAPQTVVQTLCAKVMAFLDCQVFFNFLVDEAQDGLRLNSCAGISAAEAQKIERLDYGVAVCGCAARDGCRIVAEDIAHSPDPRTELVKSYGVQAYACHPLLAQGRVLGTLSFGTTTRARFTDEELALMKAVADQVALAMERLHAKEALRHAAAELARSNEELQQFAYVASHDLQEPLRAVAGYVNLIESRFSDKFDDKGRQHIAGAVQGAMRMHNLITDLLELSRVGTRVRTLEPTDLNAVLGHVTHNLSATIGETGAQIACDPLPTLPVDASQMTQLFQNLIANALKFRGAQPPAIKIEARQEADGAWCFAVRDNGIGIDPQYSERIFLIFQRLHTRKEYPGTGIGLAICRKIVERHGGRIWVESQPGRGSIFYFTLPNQETS